MYKLAFSMKPSLDWQCWSLTL